MSPQHDAPTSDDTDVIQTPYKDMAGATKTITLRLPPEEHTAWRTAATADKRTLSSWIRKQCSMAAPSSVVTKQRPKRKVR
jgi:predicted HicB family RNase H-like nuclease